MPDASRLSIFFGAALLLAITPGPGIFYVLAQSLASGRREGALSSLGTFVGGLVHVLAAALGVSAVLAASATAFSVVKYVGAIYLIFLGIRMIQTRHAPSPVSQVAAPSRNSIGKGIWTEILNPKTALFFLAFIPQFVVPERGNTFLQFAMLGTLSVTLNTVVDLLVAFFAGSISDRLKAIPAVQIRQRVASGIGMIGLGVYVGWSGSPKTSQ